MIVALSTSAEKYMLPCLNKTLFGFECPGCGLQRSVALLFKGDFIGAFYMYPAIYTLILFFGFVAINNFWSIKHSNKIVIGLTIINLAVILTKYIFKLI